MNTIKQEALTLQPRLVSLRRRLHQCPELGADLPKTRAIITEQLRHLHDMQLEMLACLRGIGRLSGCGGGKNAQIALPEEPAAKALERRYHCARRAVTEYTARTVDGDFGIVFQHLADLSREECAALSRLLGSY